MTEVVITANSPGELSSWVRSTVASLRRLDSDLRIVVALVPCPFAAGSEPGYARAIEGVDAVLTPSQTVRFVLGCPVDGFRPSGGGVVVFMGGEPWHASLLARRLGCPAVAYLVRPSAGARSFRSVATPDPNVERRVVDAGVAAERVHVVGNLTTESVQSSLAEASRGGFGLREDGAVLGLFPGSRPLHLRAALPVYLTVAESLQKLVPGTQFVLALSPFVSIAGLEAALRRPIPLGVPFCEGARLAGGRVVTPAGLEVAVSEGRPYHVMKVMDLALTIPGTNTAEMASLGRPMVVALSAQAAFRRGGLGGLLDLLPLADGMKRTLRLRSYRRMGFSAQPNLAAGREIVPEVVVERDLAPLIETLADLLRDEPRRRAMGGEIQALMGGSGAADRMARLILEAAA